MTVERTLETTGSTIRLVIEPLPEQHVLIVEYRRKRRANERFERLRSEEGQRVPFELLNLEQSFEELFPQGGLFEERGSNGEEGEAAPAKRSRRK